MADWVQGYFLRVGVVEVLLLRFFDVCLYLGLLAVLLSLFDFPPLASDLCPELLFLRTASCFEAFPSFARRLLLLCEAEAVVVDEVFVDVVDEDFVFLCFG